MRNDDVIKSIRYTLDINDVAIAKILKLSGYQPTREEIAEIFSDQPEQVETIDGRIVEKDVSHKLTAHFLDGLIIYKRGKNDKHPPQPIKVPVTNNMVLKKLRVAFKLREGDILDILKSVDFPVSKTELSALFRADDHRNYRHCGDQLLRYFLKGLTLRFRKE